MEIEDGYLVFLHRVAKRDFVEERERERQNKREREGTKERERERRERGRERGNEFVCVPVWKLGMAVLLFCIEVPKETYQNNEKKGVRKKENMREKN